VKRTFCCWCGCSFFFFLLLHPLLQCLNTQQFSIKTCQNGIQVWWQIWKTVSVTLNTTTRISSVYTETQFSRSVIFLVLERNGTFCCCNGLIFLSLLHPVSLQCLLAHVRSIRTCPTGIRGRWQLWMPVSALSLSVATPSIVVFLNIRQLEFHPITILTCYFVLCF